MEKELKSFLDAKFSMYNQPDFIRHDPICIPHQFKKKQDIEIAGFFAAVFSWGNRTTIINKSTELLHRMDGAPHEFIIDHRPGDLKKITGFKHRTFNDTDLLYFIAFLHHHYSRLDTLEDAFWQGMMQTDHNVKNGLNGFYRYFFSLPYAPDRTRKHIACPQSNASCKRLNMFLRWMVRSDKSGVDFGIWKKIRPAQLVCPLDVHVVRVAKRFGLLEKDKADWTSAEQLTEYLKKLDPDDPVKYDYALFGLGAMEKY